MNKISFLLLIVSMLLNARINPFFLAHGSSELSITSNNLKTYQPLKSASIILPSSARILKQVTVKFINLDGSIGVKTIILSNKIDWHVPIFISQTYSTIVKSSLSSHTKKPLRIIRFHKFLVLKIFSNSIDFLTKDKNIRHFMMIEPYRIVLDFKRENDFLSFIKQIQHSVFKNVAIGNHDGYYRVVLELDGEYHYTFTKIQNGYRLVCF